jgi:hypothetical protein
MTLLSNARYHAAPAMVPQNDKSKCDYGTPPLVLVAESKRQMLVKKEREGNVGFLPRAGSRVRSVYERGGRCASQANGTAAGPTLTTGVRPC